MAISRVAKGTAQLKTSGTTLTLASVAMTAGHLLVVSFAYDDTSMTSVEWGTELLTLDSSALGAGVRTRFAWKVIETTGTQTITATWSASLTAKSMVASSYSCNTGGGVVLQQDGTPVTNTGSAAPASTAAHAAIVGGTDSLLIGVLGTEGPNGDTAGTWSTPSTNGQRLGTTGQGAATNVTVSEAYQTAPSAGATPALSKTGFTNRDWGAVLGAFYWAVPAAVKPPDFREIRRIRQAVNRGATW